MTYTEMIQERANFQSWIARERQAIIDLSKEMAKHLNWIDVYENRVKQLNYDILRYEIEQSLKKEVIS